ncbi:MAG: V-type ATP synthase subunit I [Candidatus Aenigmarchaeota archaeon]|nr:V-type ATP synthase subunit I [Candidatus Aenigmarchaeota archaeon]
MSFVTLASPKNNLEKAIEVLYDLKLLHIDPHRGQDLPIGTPLPDAEALSRLSLDLGFVTSHLPPAAEAKAMDLREAERLVATLKAQVAAIVAEREALDQQSATLEKRVKDIAFLRATGLRDPSLLAGSRRLTVMAGIATAPRRVLTALRSLDVEVFSEEKRKDGYPMVVVSQAEEGDKVKAALAEAWIPYAFDHVDQNPGVHEKALDAVAARRKALDARLAELRKAHGKELAGCRRLLRERIRKAEAPLRFAVGEHSFLIAGWVPTAQTAAVQKQLGGLPSSYLAVEDALDGPTKLANPRAVRSFEFFLNLYSLPKLREIDPTFLVFLSFPIFYGMMLGDIGYGLALYALFSVLRWRMPKYRGLFDIFLLSSIFTVVFGYVFGEFFGAEEVLGIPLVPFIHRTHDVNELMLVSLVFGLVHVNLGFVFGFVNELRTHGLRKAILAKGSWMLLEAAGILLIVDFFFGMAFIDRTIGFGVVLLSVIMLFLGEGVIGLIEIPGLISSVLSYLRLAAVGLASASLAIVVNTMADDLFAAGGAFLAIGVLVLVMGHAINIMIGLIDAFLQSLRLHYVEMFTKFYGGNGKPYNPFGR